MRVILLNGPPRSGKNTAAGALADVADGIQVIGFSHRLKRMVHGIYLGFEGFVMDPDSLDAVKGEPQQILDGMSWRQIYIHYSENVIKPMHGKEWFGEQFVRACKASNAQTVAVPDSGFREEAERVVREFGAENVRLIRIHRLGYDFGGDSRSYIDLTDLGVRCSDVENVTGNPNSMLGEIIAACSDWLVVNPIMELSDA